MFFTRLLAIIALLVLAFSPVPSFSCARDYASLAEYNSIFADIMREQFHLSEAQIAATYIIPDSNPVPESIEVVFLENAKTALSGTAGLVAMELLNERYGNGWLQKHGACCRLALDKFQPLPIEPHDNINFFRKIAPFLIFNPNPARGERHFQLDRAKWKHFLETEILPHI